MPDNGARSRSALVVEAMATGAWLGLAQVGLGFALLAGSGASALLFFALTGAWLGGGALGVLGLGSRGGALRSSGGITAPRLTSGSDSFSRASTGSWLLGLSLVALGLARAVLAQPRFSDIFTAVGLGAGALVGAYAGHFLRERAPAWGDVRALLLHENNGFVAGYAAAGALLFVSARALDAAAGVLGAVLLGRSLLRLR